MQRSDGGSLAKLSTGEGVDERIEARVAVAEPEADGEDHFGVERRERF